MVDHFLLLFVYLLIDDVPVQLQQPLFSVCPTETEVDISASLPLYPSEYFCLSSLKVRSLLSWFQLAENTLRHDKLFFSQFPF